MDIDVAFIHSDQLCRLFYILQESPVPHGITTIIVLILFFGGIEYAGRFHIGRVPGKDIGRSKEEAQVYSAENN